MKLLKKLGIYSLVLTLGVSLSGCMGSFKLLRGLYSWNENVTDNKAINNILFWCLGAFQIYTLAGAVDLFVLNFLEFWTGSNPVAMAPGEVEEQNIAVKGKNYLIRASQNTFEIYALNDQKAAILKFTPKNNTWNLQTENGLEPMAQLTEEGKVKVFLPGGQSQIFENTNENLAYFLENKTLFNAYAAK